jgi:hypothetical protein
MKIPAVEKAVGVSLPEKQATQAANVAPENVKSITTM